MNIFICLWSINILFLVADTQLYKRLCQSVRPSVRPSVCPSVRPLVCLSVNVDQVRISAPAHPSATGDHVSGLVNLPMRLSFRRLVLWCIYKYMTDSMKDNNKDRRIFFFTVSLASYIRNLPVTLCPQSLWQKSNFCVTRLVQTFWIITTLARVLAL